MAVQDTALFGELVRGHRRVLELTQEELAERAGLSDRAIREMERGSRHIPRKETVQLLADALELAGAEREAFQKAARRGGEPRPPAPEPGGFPQTNLPDEATPFIGREREIAEVVGLLGRPGVRLVTLTGAGGTGKTRLALQVAARMLRQFEDAVFVVSLASLADSRLLHSAIAEVLGVRETEGQTLVDTLVSYLQARQLLLILDNFEHLLAASQTVAQLLDACSTLHVLTTSRTILHLSREYTYEVPPFALPDRTKVLELEALSQYDAVALFIERARAARASFTVTNENALAVAEICCRLDGLPLAIVLAAARIRVFPPQALLGRLSSRLTLLTGGARDLPTRQQTLRNTIAWSYALLTDEEQRLFARLSIFAGGCTLEAAEAVCNADGDLRIDILDGVASLVEKSLLQQDGQDEPHFGMLETIREYAREQLAATGDLLRLQRHHAECYLSLMEGAEPELDGPNQTGWVSRLEAEHDNVRGALEWARHSGAIELGLRLATASSRFWDVRGHATEGSRWLDELLVAEKIDGREVSPLVRAHALGAAAWLAERQADRNSSLEEVERAQALLEERVQLLRQLDMRADLASTLLSLGNVALHVEPARADALLQESLSLAKELGNTTLIAHSLLSLSTLAQRQGNSQRAQALYKESIGLVPSVEDQESFADALLRTAVHARMRGDPGAASLFEEAMRLNQTLELKRDVEKLGQMTIFAIEEGDYRRAVALMEESRALWQEAGDLLEVGRSTGGLAWMAQEQGDYARAISLNEESLAVARRMGDRVGIMVALLRLSDVARNQGDADQVMLLTGEALALCREIGGLKYLAAFALNNLGLAARARGEYGRAIALLEESLSLMQEVAGPVRWASPLWSLGLVALDRQEYEQACRWFAESLTRSRATGMSWLVAAGLEGMAAVAIGQNEAERAVRLLAAANAIRTKLGTPIWPVNRARYESDLAAAREKLGIEGFDEAWQEGRAVMVEQAIARALEDDANREVEHPGYG